MMVPPPRAIEASASRRIGEARQRGDVERDHRVHLLDVGCEERRSARRSPRCSISAGWMLLISRRMLSTVPGRPCR